MRLLRIFFKILLLILIISTSAFGQRAIKVDSVLVFEDELRVNFSVDNLFNEKVIESLHRGLTISITYQFQLWKQRSNWFDQAVASNEMTFFVRYNKINQRYKFFSEDGTRATPSFERVNHLCSVLTGIGVTDSTQLKQGDQYYFVIKGILRPFSAESFEELGKWFRGEVEDIDLKNIPSPVESQEKITGRLLGLLKGVTGFSDQHYSVKSRNFQFERKWKVIYPRQ